MRPPRASSPSGAPRRALLRYAGLLEWHSESVRALGHLPGERGAKVRLICPASWSASVSARLAAALADGCDRARLDAPADAVQADPDGYRRATERWFEAAAEAVCGALPSGDCRVERPEPFLLVLTAHPFAASAPPDAVRLERTPG